MAMTARSDISGNMLIYILGAIFLMGLLIVLLKGSFQEGTGIDAEKTLLRVNEVRRYAAELERGVRYILNDGFSESDIRFSLPSEPDFTSIPRRQVFSSEGGGVEMRDTGPEPETGIQITTGSPPIWIYSAQFQVPQIGSTCAISSCTDLLFIVPYVTKEFCMQANRLANIPADGDEPPTQDGSFDPYTNSDFDGTFHAPPVTIDSADDDFAGKSEGCWLDAGFYHYYRVLLAR